MNLSTIDQAFWIASFVGEIALTVALLVKRQYTRFPFFFVWMTLTALSEVVLYWASKTPESSSYENFYVVSTILDFILQIGVLVELAHCVLRPRNRLIPPLSRYVFLSILAIVFGITVVWALRNSQEFGVTSTRVLQISFVFAFLRLSTFALIAGFSQMLGVTWRSHVLRLASGLAFYSAASVIVRLTISHLNHSNYASYAQDYQLLAHMQIVAYLLALALWVWSFVQKDAPRKEFTPQMERFLVTISQTAKRNRLGFSRNLGHK